MAFGTAGTEYTSPLAAGHIEMGPEGTAGAAGIAGLTITAKERAALVPHEFVAVTEISPLPAPAGIETVIEFVDPPAVIIQPVGTVQL